MSWMVASKMNKLQEAWLHKMTMFCQELHEFLAAVPPDANIACYASMDEATARRYPHMAEACDVARTQYMPGIDFSCFSEQVEDVYNMGVHACCLLNQHPALGVFQVVPSLLDCAHASTNTHCYTKSIGDVECVVEKQGIPDTRVDLFFERPLNMCMALGAEHGLQRRCTAVLAAAENKKAGAGARDGCVCSDSSRECIA